MTKMKENKGDIGFVSSNFCGAAGAKAFGFTTYWINRSQRVPDELGISPDVTVNSLADLVEFGDV